MLFKGTRLPLKNAGAHGSHEPLACASSLAFSKPGAHRQSSALLAFE